MGELSASIAHEVNQPLSAVVANANACARMLDAQPLDLEELRLAIGDIAVSGRRASEIITRIRSHVTKSDSCKHKLDINEVIVEVMPLIRGELDRHQSKLDTHLGHNLPVILGDRVELQQVLINLLMNGLEAMTTTMSGPRALTVRSQLAATGEVVVSVHDPGSGFPADPRGNCSKVFSPQSRTGWEWGCPSAARSSRHTGESCGRHRTHQVAPLFSLRWRQPHRGAHGTAGTPSGLYRG